MIKNKGSKNRLKGYIITPDGISYQYDLKEDDNFIVCPLQAGGGTYMKQVMEQTVGDFYRSIAKVKLKVTLEDERLPFLYPNYKVNFSAASACAVKAKELTEGMETDLEKIEAIYDFVAENIKYDDEKADLVKPGYGPDPDATLAEGKGICSDYSALLAAMLRSQNIPVKLVEGYVGHENIFHAWNLIYTKEKGVIAMQINFDGTWKRIDSTFGSQLGGFVEEFINESRDAEEDYYY